MVPLIWESQESVSRRVGISVIWEMVNSITLEYTCMFVPNLRSTSFLLMYICVLRLTVILLFNEKLALVLKQTMRLPIAGRETLA